jgi:hypothetical protein
MAQPAQPNHRSAAGRLSDDRWNRISTVIDKGFALKIDAQRSSPCW